jgi:hypothetical protein
MTSAWVDVMCVVCACSAIMLLNMRMEILDQLSTACVAASVTHPVAA